LEELLDIPGHRSPRPQTFEHGGNGLAKLASQLGHRVESAFDQRHQLSRGKFILGIDGGDELLLGSVLLQHGRRGPIRVRESSCETGQEMRKQLEKARSRKWEQKPTAEGLL
jgi:hypothetical protein